MPKYFCYKTKLIFPFCSHFSQNGPILYGDKKKSLEALLVCFNHMQAPAKTGFQVAFQLK